MRLALKLASTGKIPQEYDEIAFFDYWKVWPSEIDRKTATRMLIFKEAKRKANDL